MAFHQVDARLSSIVTFKVVTKNFLHDLHPLTLACIRKIPPNPTRVKRRLQLQDFLFC